MSIPTWRMIAIKPPPKNADLSGPLAPTAAALATIAEFVATHYGKRTNMTHVDTAFSPETEGTVYVWAVTTFFNPGEERISTFYVWADDYEGHGLADETSTISGPIEY